MFKSNQASAYIAANNQIVKPDVVSDVGPLQQIRLLVPSYVSFLDPTDTYLRFELEMKNARGVIVPDHKAGAHALFRNVIIRDGGNQTTLESLEDYNAQVVSVRPFTEQSSIAHKRELFEGVQKDANNSGASLYYGAPVSLAGATGQASANTTVRPSNKIEVYMQLNCGLFKGGIVPVGLMNGLRLQIDTEDPLRCLRQPFLGSSLEGGLASCPETAADLAQGAITRAANTPAQNVFGLTTGIASSAAGENNPFAIGDKIYLDHDTGGNGVYASEILFGVCNGFYISGGKLGLSIVGQANTTVAVPADANYTTANKTKFYYKVADRQSDFSSKSAACADNTNDLTIKGVSYNISEIEMRCSSVSPPPAYVEGMMRKAMSPQGIQIDYLTSELHRHNQQATQGVIQAQIPTLAQRAKSIIVQPIPTANYRDLTLSSLSGVPDSAKNYQFVKGTELIPSRLVNLERYSLAVGATNQVRNEPLHTAELQKALVNIGQSVYSLQNIADNFAIARSFNKYGQITNLAGDTLSLRVDYSALGSQKILNCYVYKLARMSIAMGQVQVIS